MNLLKSVDHRGMLSALEFSDLPFVPRRAFWIRNMPEGSVRGGHAHRRCHQWVVWVSGTFDIRAVNRVGSHVKRMQRDGDIVHAAPLTWLTIEALSADAVVLVFCSEPYDELDYIRDKDEFTKCLAA